MNWTTEYPKKPGFYWIRNYQILGPSETVSRSERTMAYVTPVNQGLNFWLFQYPDIFRPFDVLSAEWQGPIEPERERRNRSEFIRATPGMVCRECGETDKRSFVSWKVGEADGKPMYGIICRDCWIKRLTPEQRKVYMV